MIITLNGRKEEIRHWIVRQQRLTGKKINYTTIEAENGQSICILQEGIKEDYPRQRIVRKHIER